MDQNEKEFVEQLYTEYKDQIYYLAYQYVKQEKTAEAVVLKIFRLLIDNISIVNRFNIQQMSYILCAMARYLIIKHMKKPWNLMYPAEFQPVDSVSNGEKEEEEDPDLAQWIACLKKIPKKDMDLFLLYYDYKLTYYEISNLLGLSHTKVRKRIKRANTRFRNALNKIGD